MFRSQAVRGEKEFLLSALVKPFADFRDLRPLLQNIDNVLYLLLIVFLPTQLGRHFWLNDSIVGGMRVDYLSPTLYLTDLLIVSLFFATVFKKKTYIVLSPMVKHRYFLALLFCVVFINIVLADYPVIGIYGLVKLMELVFFGLYTKYVFQKMNRNILISFSIGMLFESAIAIFQFVKQSSVGGLLYFFGERAFHSQTPGIANASVYGHLVLRPYGTFPHPNVLAGYLLVGIMLLVLCLRANTSLKKNRLLFIFIIFISSIALFITLSRIAIILWLMSVFWIVFIKGQWGPFQAGTKFYCSSGGRLRRPESRTVTSRLATLARRIINIERNSSLILFFIFTLSLFLFSETARGRFTENIFTGESLEQRLQLAISAITMWQAHPIFGVGLNNFLTHLPAYYPGKSLIFYLQPVHNVFLLTLAEGGVIIFLPLLFFFWRTYEFCKKSSSLLLIVTFFILGSIDHYLFTLQQGQLLTAFVFGFLWVKNKIHIID
ncbi:MAG: O-antigen ligase family protein [Candidatus Levybacteria bacterium]|nr:O-antigen ligase family protein [Candidatus Levybacteria bacterium]